MSKAGPSFSKESKKEERIHRQNQYLDEYNKMYLLLINGYKLY